ncbi:NnrS family protein [Methylocaldum marinum]|uniref:NnrS family protein n=1 Tax=Methylocaldum marinum TaxID=1432792 RepID=A0A250KSW8_9GAMM|nr:NnrS family protein [Methylocaldum marinum]BBA34051.1 NnrS family protein [Methylocaldum marinum]
MAPIHFDPRILFSYAFRAFFLLVGIHAVLAISAWGLHLSGVLAWPEVLPAAVRHGHEMIFGFAGAAIAGFLLTAVATWTGRPPVAGTPLLILCVTWLVARMGAFTSGSFGAGSWAAGSVLFWGGLLALVAREVVAVRNIRNYKVLVLLTAFLATEVYFFFVATGDLAAQEAGLRMGLSLVLGMILLVGGRIIPSFTQNWLRLNHPGFNARLPHFDRLDGIAVAVTLLFAVGFITSPRSAGAGVLGIAASVLQFVRLARWRGWLAYPEPLLWILHVGYAWIPIGLALLGASMLLDRWSLWDSGLHALGYGAIGTMILGVAARVALGHTGRPLRAFPSMTTAFAMLTVGTVARLFAQPGDLFMVAAIGLWTAAYLLFLVRYLPILLAPRLTT